MSFVEDILATQSSRFYKEHMEALDQRANPVDPEADGHFGKSHPGFKVFKRIVGLDKKSDDGSLKAKPGDKLNVPGNK